MEGLREIEVTTVGELIDAITPEHRDEASGRFRDSGVFRGSSHTDWPLLSSLDRLGGVHPPHTKACLEEHILRNFQRYSRAYMSERMDNEWELLVVARHHGLPTRLIDWTYSPLIAAHFATLNERKEADRVIWRLDWRAIHEHYGLKPLAFLITDLEEMLRDLGTSLADLIAGSAPEEVRFMCMLEPPALDARLVAQSANFMLCSSKNESIDQFLVKEGLAHTITRYIVPWEHRDRMRDQLDLCGIDERRLFPDLDGVAAQMRRYYS